MRAPSCVVDLALQPMIRVTISVSRDCNRQHLYIKALQGLEHDFESYGVFTITKWREKNSSHHGQLPNWENHFYPITTDFDLESSLLTRHPLRQERQTVCLALAR